MFQNPQFHFALLSGYFAVSLFTLIIRLVGILPWEISAWNGANHLEF